MMPQIDFSTYASQALWTGIYFILTFAVIHHFILPEIKMIEKRKKNIIEELLSVAKKNQNEYHRIKKNMEEMLHSQNIENLSRLKHAESDANYSFKKEMGKFHKELATKEQEEVKEIDKNITNLEKNILENIDLFINEICESLHIDCSKKVKEKIAQNITSKYDN